jgi:hypothetical protein
MNVFVDLFSGLGGASHAFDESPDWCTFKIDNNPELLEFNRGLHILDIADTETVIRMIENMLCEIGHRFHETMVIWASPPCNQFSWARQNGDNPRRKGQTAEEFDMTLFDAALDIIEHFSPDHWIIENVLGAVPIVEHEYSMTPTQQIGSIVLWGNFPSIALQSRDDWSHRKLDAKGSRSLRPNWRAKIPQSVSFGLLDSLARQRTLKEWLPIEGIEE